MSRPKTQHYVPQFYLDAFCSVRTRKRKQKKVVAVDDLRESKIFSTGLNNVACENHYYEVAISDKVSITIDPALQRLESLAARAFETLRGSLSVLELSRRERDAIALFITVQSVRGPALRRSLEAQPKMIIEHVRKFGPVAPELEKGLESRTPEHAAALQIGLIEEIARLYPLLLDRAWRVALAPKGKRCCTSDTPVFKYNERKPRPFGNLGFCSPGVVFELAISPTALLSIAEPDMYDVYDGEVLRLTEDNLLHYHGYLANSANRFLYAKSAADFDVRPGMWEDKPGFTIRGVGPADRESGD